MASIANNVMKSELRSSANSTIPALVVIFIIVSRIGIINGRLSIANKVPLFFSTDAIDETNEKQAENPRLDNKYPKIKGPILSIFDPKKKLNTRNKMVPSISNTIQLYINLASRKSTGSTIVK